MVFWRRTKWPLFLLFSAEHIRLTMFWGFWVSGRKLWRGFEMGLDPWLWRKFDDDNDVKFNLDCKFLKSINKFPLEHLYLIDFWVRFMEICKKKWSYPSARKAQFRQRKLPKVNRRLKSEVSGSTISSKFKFTQNGGVKKDRDSVALGLNSGAKILFYRRLEFSTSAKYCPWILERLVVALGLTVN